MKWLDSVPQRVYDFWHAYYQCEPFGCEWEQTASILSMLSQNTAMLAASRGIEMKAASVVDFMPSDSVPWMRRKKQAKRSKGITDPKLQELRIKQAFGF